MVPRFQGLESTPHSIQLLPNFVTADVSEFELAVWQDSLVSLEFAASLYTGDFLQGFSLHEDPFEQWRAREIARIQELSL